MTTIYKDYAGISMPTSSASTLSQWGKGQDDTLVGGGVDDTFYIYSPSETVIERVGAMATVVIETWFPYALAANVKNMIVQGNPGTATGNALDNLIVAQGSVDMIIDGGTGNDVIVANRGTDTFVFDGKSGHDVIYDFDSSKDILRLTGTIASNFAALQSRMTQHGQDVVLTLSDSTSVTLRKTMLGQITAANFAPVIDTSTLTLTFHDEFDDFASSPDGSTGWKSTYHGAGRTFSNNHEAEYYSDDSTGVNPFSDRDGILTITAAPASSGQTPSGSGLTYTSGVITTETSFSQLYGYFEARLQLPSGQGFWPAFWMLPADNSWPPEIDVMEQVGGNTTFQTSHSNDGGFNTQSQFSTQVTGNATGFHTYGVDWEADKITWYVDGVGVASTATPSDMHTSMYMLLNLAVGADGSWPGAADGRTVGELKVDYIRAYASMADAARPPAIAITAQTLASDSGASATDRITRNGRVTLAGTVAGASGARITVYDGTVALGTAKSGGDGTWTYTTRLAIGTHALHAVAANPAGDSGSTAAAAMIIVDATAPTVAITAWTTQGLSTVLKGTVSAETGTTVALFNGATKVGDAVVDSLGGWTFGSDLQPGRYRLSALATDLAGNRARAVQPLGFTVRAASAAIDTLALTMSQDAFGDDARFIVSVDGKQVGGPQTVTARHDGGHTQNFIFTGRFGAGAHDVVVDYLNDAWGGSQATDRNLYVDSIGFNGALTARNAGQYEKGAVHYQVSATASARSGAVASVPAGARLIVDGTAAASATVFFAGSGSVAEFTSAAAFRGSIKGFDHDAVLDLRSILSSQASVASLFYTDAGSSGVLHVSDGVHSASLTMVGAYAGGHFSAVSDSFGGTAVSWAGNPA